MRIVALDFETANNHLESAIALGVAIYLDGELIDNFEWYFKPHYRYNSFVFTYIHGIEAKDVENEEEFIFYYDKLADLLKDSVVVAHNAPFDIGVLNAVCDAYGLKHLSFPYLDTVAIARRVYPELYNHRLNTVSEYLDIPLKHHNGKSDAYACLMILIKSMMAYHSYDIDDFLQKIKMKMKENL